MKTDVYLCSHLAQFFLQCDMFQTKVENKKHIFSNFFFSKIVPFMK
jgi:hypothetical protein